LSSAIPRRISGRPGPWRHRRATLEYRPPPCGSARRGSRRGFEIAGGAHDIFGFGHFDDTAAGFLIGALERIGHVARRHAVGGELLRIDHDLILLDHAADAGDFGDAGNDFSS
jgi:hypothetical protein